MCTTQSKIYCHGRTHTRTRDARARALNGTVDKRIFFDALAHRVAHKVANNFTHRLHRQGNRGKRPIDLCGVKTDRQHITHGRGGGRTLPQQENRLEKPIRGIRGQRHHQASVSLELPSFARLSISSNFLRSSSSLFCSSSRAFCFLLKA